MDFLDFDNHELYFDAAMSSNDQALLKKAAETYPKKQSETILLELHSRLPDNLTIIVALYRYYYYQNRYDDALEISTRALSVASEMMGLRVDWKDLTEQYLGEAVLVSMGLIRFYMLALKASAYLLIRVGEINQAYARLKIIVDLDPADQFGANMLLKIAERELNIEYAQQHNVTSIYN